MELNIILYSLSGGAGKIAANLAAYFVKMGQYGKVSIITNSGEPELLSKCKRNGVGLAVLKQGGLISFSYRASSLSSRNGYNVVFASPLFSIYSFFCYFRQPRFSLSNVILRETTATEMLIENRNVLVRTYMKLAIYFFSKKTNLIIANSIGTATSLANYLSKKEQCKVIYNPVFTKDEFNCIRSKGSHSLRPESKIRMVAVGRFAYQKGFDVLIEAMAYLVNKCSINVQLDIYGKGPLHDVLNNLIEKNNLTNHVFLKGYSQEPHNIYNQYSIFVLSSRFEGFGNVLVEALASGMRIVAVDNPSGPKEILDHGRYGRLVPHLEAIELASAIKNEIEYETSSPTERIARAEVFCVENIAPIYSTYINQSAMNQQD